VRRLRETVKQANGGEDLSKVIANYEELELCFRHSDSIHFQNRRAAEIVHSPSDAPDEEDKKAVEKCLATWSILVPICSRPKVFQAPLPHDVSKTIDRFNSNRFIDLAVSSQHNPSSDVLDAQLCWTMLEQFGESLRRTASVEQLERTEYVVGIDKDDPLYNHDDESRTRIRQIFLPCQTIFVEILPDMYGQVCKIWNALGGKCNNEYIILLGDDIQLLDMDWQLRVVQKFHSISQHQNLPLGAACAVAMKDLAFPGFPTFPVVHRWHIDHFGAILPKQFANQGGDPYLFELYSRYNAAAFEVSCRLENTIGGDGDARYQKHQINWRGQILSMNLRSLKSHHLVVGRQSNGVCLDVVVPCYRVNNEGFLRRILLLRATVPMYVKFWIVIDNPLPDHIEAVKHLAADMNKKSTGD
jgi:hypothetical protein